MTDQAPVSVSVDPGICGFPCTIVVTAKARRQVKVEITGSDCKHVQQLGAQVTEIGLKELFKPLSRHPIFVSAERAGCHSACPIPAALVKAVEVAMGLALPKAVRIDFIEP